MALRNLMPIAVLGGAALVSVSLLAQTEPTADHPPIFRTRSNWVLVDLIVTVNGEFVPDLTVDEVEVREDGKKQRIGFFEAIDLERSGTRQVREGVDLPGSAQFAVLLDLAKLSPESRRFVAPAIREFVGGKMVSGDFVMLATIGRGDLRIPVPLTEDLPLVVKTAEEILSRTDSWQRNEGPATGVLKEIPVAVDLPEPDPLTGEVPPTMIDAGKDALDTSEKQQNKDSLRRELQDLARSITLLSRYLQGLAGRKNAVLFTRGYALRSSGTSFEDVLDEAIAAANKAHVSFYTVDPSPLGEEDLTIGRLRFSPEGPIDIRPIEADVSQTDRQALHTVLARHTGGLAVLGTNQLTRALQVAYRDSKRYYRLAYVPMRTSIEPGKSHRIAVLVKRKGADVRSRDEVVEPDPQADLQFDVTNALAFPELFREFEFSASADVTDGGSVVLHTRIPKGDVEFRSDRGDSVAEVAFFASLTRSDGRPVLEDRLPLSRTYTLRLSPDQFAAIDVLTTDHPIDVALPSGEYTLTVAVHQPWAQRVSASRMKLVVP